MSITHLSGPVYGRWWLPFHLWRQFLVASVLAMIVFLGGVWLIGPDRFSPFIEDDPIGAFAVYGVLSATVIVFDGSWLAALFGATWNGVLRFPILPRFWLFLFAWIAIDLFFFGAWKSMIWLQDAAAADMPAHSGAINALAGLLASVGGFMLLWLRVRLALWPVHVLATGHVGDLSTPWQKTAGETSGLFGILATLVALGVAASILAAAMIIILVDPYLHSRMLNTAWCMVLLIIFRAILNLGFVRKYQGVASEPSGTQQAGSGRHEWRGW